MNIVTVDQLRPLPAPATRAEFYKARHDARAYDRAERQHRRDQVMADCTQPFRAIPPPHYWFATSFERWPDPLIVARDTRRRRAEHIRFCRAKLARRESDFARLVSERRQGAFHAAVEKMEREALEELRRVTP